MLRADDPVWPVPEAWMVLSLRPVSWQPPDDESQWPTWTHVTTRIQDSALSVSGPVRGDTIWTAALEDGQLALAWEWVEWRPGVIVLSDPMAISSNILTEDDAPHGPRVRAITLNRVAHSLPWQQQVLEALRAKRAATASQAQQSQDALPAYRRAA